FPTPRPEPPPVAPTTRPTTLPHPIQQPAPRYPRDAYRRGEQGTVLLRVHVDARGEPGDIDLIDSSGSRSLDRAAIDAVRRWRFAPAMQGETPVEGAVQVPIEVALGRQGRKKAPLIRPCGPPAARGRGDGRQEQERPSSAPAGHLPPAGGEEGCSWVSVLPARGEKVARSAG